MIKIETRQGDISDQPDLEAIVNAANTELWMGSGVAGAIRRRAGAVVEKEAVRLGPIRLGETVLTQGGSLANRFVIHAAAMSYRTQDATVPKRAGSVSSADIIRDATLNALRLCDRHRIRSIGFPALATGVGGFPVDECAETMIRAAVEYGKQNPATQIERVVFVLYSAADHGVFHQMCPKEAR